jgi:hypothetical protein
LLKLNEQGIALQRSLQAQARESNSAANKSVKTAALSASASARGGASRKDGSTRGTKRGREDVRVSFVSFAGLGPLMSCVSVFFSRMMAPADRR